MKRILGLLVMVVLSIGLVTGCGQAGGGGGGGKVQDPATMAGMQMAAVRAALDAQSQQIASLRAEILDQREAAARERWIVAIAAILAAALWYWKQGSRVLASWATATVARVAARTAPKTPEAEDEPGPNSDAQSGGASVFAVPPVKHVTITPGAPA